MSRIFRGQEDFWTETIKNWYKKLKDADSTADMWLRSMDRRMFKAHKMVLSGWSPVLKELIQDMRNHEPILDMKKTIGDCVENMIQFMYTGQTNIKMQNKENFEWTMNYLQVGCSAPPRPASPSRIERKRQAKDIPENVPLEKKRKAIVGPEHDEEAGEGMSSGGMENGNDGRRMENGNDGRRMENGNDGRRMGSGNDGRTMVNGNDGRGPLESDSEYDDDANRATNALGELKKIGVLPATDENIEWCEKNKLADLHKQYNCQVCGLERLGRNLMAHLWQHASDYGFNLECPDCRKLFKNPSSFHIHKIKRHCSVNSVEDAISLSSGPSHSEVSRRSRTLSIGPPSHSTNDRQLVPVSSKETINSKGSINPASGPSHLRSPSPKQSSIRAPNHSSNIRQLVPISSKETTNSNTSLNPTAGPSSLRSQSPELSSIEPPSHSSRQLVQVSSKETTNSNAFINPTAGPSSLKSQSPELSSIGAPSYSSNNTKLVPGNSGEDNGYMVRKVRPCHVKTTGENSRENFERLLVYDKNDRASDEELKVAHKVCGELAYKDRKASDKNLKLYHNTELVHLYKSVWPKKWDGGMYTMYERFNCNLCEFEKKKKNEIINHIESKHLQTFKLECPDCRVPCNTTDILKNHMRRNCSFNPNPVKNAPSQSRKLKSPAVRKHVERQQKALNVQRPRTVTYDTEVLMYGDEVEDMSISDSCTRPTTGARQTIEEYPYDDNEHGRNDDNDGMCAESEDELPEESENAENTSNTVGNWGVEKTLGIPLGNQSKFEEQDPVVQTAENSLGPITDISQSTSNDILLCFCETTHHRNICVSCDKITCDFCNINGEGGGKRLCKKCHKAGFRLSQLDATYARFDSDTASNVSVKKKRFKKKLEDTVNTPTEESDSPTGKVELTHKEVPDEIPPTPNEFNESFGSDNTSISITSQAIQSKYRLKPGASGRNKYECLNCCFPSFVGSRATLITHVEDKLKDEIKKKKLEATLRNFPSKFRLNEHLDNIHPNVIRKNK